jgi:uncharacterized protein YjgD (DUF1641 family)
MEGRTVAEHRTETIQLTEIFLDPENPRHDEIQSQRDLISAMVTDQGDKLVRLAKDIIDIGINPSDIPILIPHSSENDKYFVVEGNRRITALKLLHEPSLCSNKKLSKRFMDLKEVFAKSPINEVQCVIYNDRESSDHWVDLKHTGANNGIGTEQWDSTAKRRRIDRQKKTPRKDLQLKNFLSKCDALDSEAQKAFKQLDITTVNRLVGDPDIRKFLGLTLSKGILFSKYSLLETIRVLEAFFAPFATGAKNVTDVYHKDDRTDYRIKLDQSTSADQTKAVEEPWPLNSPPPLERTPQANNTSPSTDNNPTPQTNSSQTTALGNDQTPTAPDNLAAPPEAGPASPARTPSRPLSKNRKCLIDKSISIPHKRINGIYTELRKLDVHAFENSVAVLFRVFLELSLDVYISKNAISTHENDKLRNKVEKVGKFMKQNNLLTDQQLKPVNKAVSDNHSLFSTNTLNAYVHNSTIQPKGTELNATWDEMSDFIRQLWA